VNSEAKISYYETVRSDSPDGAAEIKSFIESIRTEEYAEGVARVRAATTEDEKDAAKIKLPAVQISGKVTSGKRAQAIQQGRFDHSGWLQLDVDGPGLNDMSPEDARDMLGKDPHVLSAFISPSGEGVKALFRIKPCLTDEEHKTAFAHAAEYILASYGFALDKGTKDTGRLCFVSADKECTWNPFPEKLVIPEPQETPPQAAKAKVDTPLEDGGFSLAETAEDVRALLAAIPPRPEYMEWLTVCSAVWDALGEIEGTALLQEWSAEESAGEYANKFKDRLKNVHAGTLVSIAKANGFDTRRAAAAKHAERDGPSPRMKGPWDKQAAPGDGGKVPPTPESFRDMLAARAFDAANPPTQPVPVIKLGGKCIATIGNVMALQAGIKSGKTATVGAIIAAFVIGDGGGEHDTLGFTAANPEGHAVLHFDTEQSRYDHDGVIRRALARVGMTEPPEWFQSFCLTDMSPKDRMRAIDTTIEDAVATFGGVRAAILDGVADFMRDPNDAEEAFGLVDKLHALAITHGCTIPCVIHENPGSDKTRGHLGSQLARKAETNLRLHKDPATGITTMWADHARHCHIPKDAGTCFAWCDTVGRHISKGTAGAIKASIKTGKFREEAQKAFGDEDALGYSALVAAIMGAVEITVKTAEKRVVTYQAEGIVRKDASGSYRLK
jgi:hypothetical protein